MKKITYEIVNKHMKKHFANNDDAPENNLDQSTSDSIFNIVDMATRAIIDSINENIDDSSKNYMSKKVKFVSDDIFQGTEVSKDQAGVCISDHGGILIVHTNEIYLHKILKSSVYLCEE